MVAVPYSMGILPNRERRRWTNETVTHGCQSVLLVGLEYASLQFTPSVEFKVNIWGSTELMRYLTLETLE